MSRWVLSDFILHFLFLFSAGIAAVPVRVSSSPRETVVHRSDRQVTQSKQLI